MFQKNVECRPFLAGEKKCEKCLHFTFSVAHPQQGGLKIYLQSRTVLQLSIAHSQKGREILVLQFRVAVQKSNKNNLKESALIANCKNNFSYFTVFYF